MSNRPIVSIFLIGHLTALAVSAVPSPSDLRSAEGVRESADDAVSSRVRPALDSAAWLLQGFVGRAWRFTGWIRPMVKGYVGRLGLTQNWSMFGNPPRGSEYLRLRYYSARAQPVDGGAFMVATELVFPVVPETETRLFQAYWQAARDKAVSNALVAYFRQRLDRKEAGQSSVLAGDEALDRALARSFVPVVHFFSHEYVRSRLPAGDRLVQTEAWYGFAASRFRGDGPLSPEARATAIERYYRGPLRQSVSESPFHAIDSTEREADILWVLIYTQT